MSPSNRDTLFRYVSLGFASAVCAVLACIVLFVMHEAWPALQQLGITRFLFDGSWHPSEGRFNLVPMVVATLFVSVGAITLAAPLGILLVFFIQFYAPRSLAIITERVLEVLAGIPSVVYGFWGLVVLVPWIYQFNPPGSSLLAGILILALMILPTMALMSLSAVRQIANEQYLASAALSLSNMRKLQAVVFPGAWRGLVVATVISLARAVGETMAVLMVCGNVVKVPSSIFDPVRALTANIALEMAYALGQHRSALFFTGMMLLLLVSSLFVIGEWLQRGRLRVSL